MPYHTHKLNSSHSHIIGRTDPITGDSVKENDKVVFCAVCKSCFLEDSWVYMNENHCEQSQTLYAVPVLASKLVARKTKEEVIAELKHDKIVVQAVLATLTLSFLAAFSVFKQTIYQQDSDTTIAFALSPIISVILSFIVGSLTATDMFNEFVGYTKNDVRLFKNRIEIGAETFLLNDIKQIKYQREMYIQKGKNMDQHLSHIPFLLIYFKNDNFLKRNLATKSHKKTQQFLVGLEKISHFKDIFFYSENPKELQKMRDIKYRSKGSIQIGQPRKLLNDNSFW
ncbi:hypothetical protein WAF17_04275 [Bernardetia sp. ABR2-2B]|uniref:hypothetical protein n=1 Tax=Bernardetia sp. ABR2-2B TaxID=3127472 RepID=UPI0030CD6675